MIIDDPVKGAEEAASPAYQRRLWGWWQNDMRTRLNNIATTPICLIQTRWNDMDLAGRILEQDKKRKLWHVISFPALATENDLLGRQPGESLWPERLPVEELEALREDLKISFEALYQQDPTPAEGGMIKDSWFWYGKYEPEWIIGRCRFWDVAGSAVSRKNYNPDYTAGCRMALVARNGDKNNPMYAVEDMARIRAEPGERDRFIESVARADGPDILQIFEEVDDGDKSVTASLRNRLQPYSIQVAGARPRNDKVVRSTNMRSALENGNLLLIDGRWNGEFIAEMVRFPNGKHDDQVDAASGAFNHLVSNSLRVSVL
jgi:predicted phage terminase large subunit-like protein